MKRITTLLLSLFLPVALYAAWPSGSGGGGGTAATWPVSGTPAGFADGIDDAGGSANLAVGTGTAAGFGVAITSPTAAINFDRTIFAGTLTGDRKSVV